MKDQAFPTFGIVGGGAAHIAYGLTKREYYAAMAMQGILCTGDFSKAPMELADNAVIAADALIAALAGEKDG